MKKHRESVNHSTTPSNDGSVFEDYPPIALCEGPDHDDPEKIHRGPIAGGYSRSLYEFHYEYPIGGFGVRKDLIIVIEEGGARTPIFDYCRITIPLF